MIPFSVPTLYVMDNKGHRDQKMAVGEEIDVLYCKTIVIK